MEGLAFETVTEQATQKKLSWYLGKPSPQAKSPGSAKIGPLRQSIEYQLCLIEQGNSFSTKRLQSIHESLWQLGVDCIMIGKDNKAQKMAIQVIVRLIEAVEEVVQVLR